jgi:hypothetical protein
MTRKRCLIVAGLLVALICAGSTVTLLIPSMPSNQPGVTKANFDRIEEGMTLQEVEQIFGRPGTYTWSCYWWQADGARVFVEFDYNGASAGRKTWWEDSTEPILDKLRRWLHLG